MKSEIINTLKNLGFTEYEAKAYIALLEKSPLSGYGVALNSGVPRSKIYEVLDGMAQNGEVMVSYGAPVLYSPLEPKELIDRRRNKSKEIYDIAYNSLENFSAMPENRDNIWNISGSEDIINKAKQLISQTKEELLVEVGAEELEKIAQELNNAVDRGVELMLVTNSQADIRGAVVFVEEENEFKNIFAICGDDREAICGSISDKSNIAAVSINPGFVISIKELISRKIVILKQKP